MNKLGLLYCFVSENSLFNGDILKLNDLDYFEVSKDVFYSWGKRLNLFKDYIGEIIEVVEIKCIEVLVLNLESMCIDDLSIDDMFREIGSRCYGFGSDWDYNWGRDCFSWIFDCDLKNDKEKITECNRVEC